MAHPRKQRPTDSSSIVDGELYTDVNEKAFISNSSENYVTHFEAGTEFAVGVEPADALLSIVCERLFALRLGQLSTWYVSRRPAQEN